MNIVLASGRIGCAGCGYATITGQANGQGGREHGQKCDQLPGLRDIDNPEHRADVAKIWAIAPAELPGKGVDAYEIFRKIDRGEIRGLLSICFNPKVSLPDNHFIGRMLDKLDFYVAIDFFLNESARHADVVLPGSLQEEDEGLVTMPKAASSRLTSASIRPATRGKIGALFKTSPKHLAANAASRSTNRVKSLTSFAVRRRVASQIIPASPTKRSNANSACFGRARATTTRARRGFLSGARGPVVQGRGPFYFPDGKSAL